VTISHAASTGVSATTGARGTTSTNVAYVGVSAGRMGVLTVCVKPSTATLPATVTDGGSRVWDKLVEGTGGTGTNAADTGTSRIAKYIRVFDGTETGNVTITASNTPSQVCGAMDVYSTTTAWKSPIAVTASDASHGTNPSATASTVWAAALAAGDLINVGYATDTDDSTAASGHNITQTSTTFGTVTARSRVGNSDGNDGSVFTWDAPVNSGGSTNQPQFSMTWAINSCGPFAAVRLRDTTALSRTMNVGDSFGDGTIDTGAWDPWGGAQITESSGRLNLATTTTAGGYYGIARLATVDLAAQEAGFRLISTGNQALASYTGYVAAIQLSTNNEAFWTISGGMVRFFTNVGGTQTQRIVFPHLSDTHRYFSIGFSSGNLIALWSKDGSNWINEFSLANPYSGDTVGIAYAMVGTDSAEASTTTLVLDDYFTTGSTPVSQTVDLRWTSRAQVSADMDLRWKSAAQVQSSLDLQWRSYVGVSSDTDLRWRSYTQIQPTIDLQWKSYVGVSQSTDLRWRSFALVQQSVDVRWKSYALVQQTTDLRWRDYVTIFPTISLQWRSYAQTAGVIDLRWKTAGQVANTVDLRWRVAATVSQTTDLRWKSYTSLSQNLDLRWKVAQNVSQTVDLRWRSIARVSNDLDVRWKSSVIVSQTSDLRWRSFVGINQSLDLRWKSHQRVTTDVDLQYRVYSRLSETTDLRWLSYVDAPAKDLDLRWRSMARVSSDMDLRWKVLSTAIQVQQTVDLRWKVSTLVSQTTDLRWRAYNSMSSSVDLRWRDYVDISPQDIYLIWRSYAPVSSDLDVRWKSYTGLSQQLDLRWVSRARVSSDSDLRWRVSQIINSQLDLRWRNYVRLNNTVDLRWRTAEIVSQTSDLRWRVIGRVNSDILLLWVSIALGAAPVDNVIIANIGNKTIQSDANDDDLPLVTVNLPSGRVWIVNRE